ncbi:MAG: AAA family ATPase [Ruminococcus sp.]|nr:AAA family ATPase [Ruminococcus sp.]MBQ7133126.1 AAA family ATPase [Ruminococcus sp.]
MSQVIVVASGKGGTGKTTVSTSLALALVRKQNKVLVIDCDSGMRGTDMMLGITDRLVYDLSDVVSGTCDLDDALYECTGASGLFTLAAPVSAEDEISPQVMKQFITNHKNDYDYVIVDAPAGVGSGFEGAAIAADRALIVVNTEPTSIRGGVNIREKLTQMGITDVRLVINRFDKERFIATRLYDDLDQVIDTVGVRLIGLVPEDVRISALAQRGLLATNWASSSVVFDSIAQRLTGDNIPLTIKL